MGHPWVEFSESCAWLGCDDSAGSVSRREGRGHGVHRENFDSVGISLTNYLRDHLECIHATGLTSPTKYDTIIPSYYHEPLFNEDFSRELRSISLFMVQGTYL